MRTTKMKLLTTKLLKVRRARKTPCTDDKLIREQLIQASKVFQNPVIKTPAKIAETGGALVAMLPAFERGYNFIG